MKANTFFSILATLCFFLITTNLSAQDDKLVIIPTYDTYVTCSSKDTKSFSSEEFLKTRNRISDPSEKLESYIQFKIPKKQYKNIANVTRAKFRILESGKGLKGEKDFRVAILSENEWDNTLSGKQRKELKLGDKEVSKTIKSFTKLDGESEVWYEVDVTRFIKVLEEPVVSFRIYNKPQEEDTDSLIFYASEVEGKGPELIIEF